MTKRLRKKLQKLQHRLKVTFEQVQDCDAVGVAMIGQGYGVSMEESGLTHGRVAYRMKLAREAYKMPKGVGFAQQYRQGKTALAVQVRQEVLPAIRATLMEVLPAWRKHPTPKTACK
jgi:hypothetical protein